MTPSSEDSHSVFLTDRSEAVPKKDNITVHGTVEKSQPKAATDSWAFENSASCQSRNRLHDCCGSAFLLQKLERTLMRKTETNPILRRRRTFRRLMADYRG
jgi:hypothetical protein